MRSAQGRSGASKAVAGIGGRADISVARELARIAADERAGEEDRFYAVVSLQGFSHQPSLEKLAVASRQRTTPPKLREIMLVTIAHHAQDKEWAARQLRKSFEDPTDKVAKSAVALTAQLGVAALPFLAQGIEHEREAVRSEATRQLRGLSKALAKSPAQTPEVMALRRTWFLRESEVPNDRWRTLYAFILKTGRQGAWVHGGKNAVRRVLHELYD